MQPMQSLGHSCFNSILVQLEAVWAGVRKMSDDARFQFHIGAIRSVLSRIRTRIYGCFNSILVQLEVYASVKFAPLMSGFNSILVQLEARPPPVMERILLCFNSILVQLEDGDGDGSNISINVFQFHIGAIRRPDLPNIPGWHVCVSIPYWCN